MSSPIGMYQKLALTRANAQALQGYLASRSVAKLQLGAGTNVLEGWFNTDKTATTSQVFTLDSSKPFPFPDSTFQYVFSEHHLEHLTYREGLTTLRESYRVLKPQGKIRLATPSLEKLLALYTPTPDEAQQRYIRFITDAFLPEVRSYNPLFVINNAFRNWGHQLIYDWATLQRILEEVGFVDIVHTRPGESTDEHLCNIERHGQFIGSEELNSYETMVLEGTRPS